jgi:hypothetical protein
MRRIRSTFPQLLYIILGQEGMISMKQYACLLIVLLCAAALASPSSAQAVTLPIQGYAWYDIYTNVDVASIYFDGIYQGQTSNGYLPVQVSVPSSYSTVTAQRSGYNSASASLPFVAMDKRYSVSLSLTPLVPSYGWLNVNSVPSGASVYVDSTYRGKTPQTIQLNHDSYFLSIEKDGYYAYQKTVYVYAGQTTYVSSTLDEKPVYGTLSVTTSPAGAYVYVDGTYKGVTPAMVGGLTEGAHFVELTKSGYQDWTGSIRIYAKQTTYLSQALTPVSGPTTGAIAVTSNPSYASVSLDGVYQGQTEPGSPFIISEVAAGTHTVMVRLTGYEDSVSSVTVNSGQTSTVEAALVPATADTGALSVSSSPTGADVYIDNVKRGIAPVTLDTMQPGTYTVSLRLAGYSEWSGQAVVNAGATSYVSGTLSPIPEETPAPIIPAAFAFALLGGLYVSARRRNT